MRVYHFLNKKYALKDLKERRLRISRIMELNDPFEFLGAELSNREFRKAMNQTKKELSKTTGILCFSKKWTDPVQWSHYADRHKGICLGFDVPGHLLFKVKYVRDRLPINGGIDEKRMLEFLTTKFIHWAYEQEYRLFISLEDDEDGLYYADFSDNLKLRQIIVGCQSDVTRAELDAVIKGINSDIEIFKTRPAFRSFKIVRNKNDKLWA